MDLRALGSLPEELAASGRVSQLLKIAATAPEERIHLMEAANRLLGMHPVASAWRATKAAGTETPHFAKYRKDALRYDKALVRLSTGNGGAEELELVRALSAEIARSPLILRRGQVVLSGALPIVPAIPRYPSFLMTTINPIGAVEHAARHAERGDLSLPIVHVLHIATNLPGLLGKHRSRDQWAILLPRRLQIAITETHSTTWLHVREAVVST